MIVMMMFAQFTKQVTDHSNHYFPKVIVVFFFTWRHQIFMRLA